MTMSTDNKSIENSQSLAILLAYTSGSNFQQLKRGFGTLSNIYYDRMNDEPILRKLHVLNNARVQLSINSAMFDSMPYKLNYLAQLLGDEMFDDLLAVELPYQPKLFSDSEVKNSDNRRLTLVSIYNRLTEGVILVLQEAYTDLLPPELDYTKIFMLDMAETSSELDYILTEMKRGRIFYKSKLYLLPPLEIDIEVAESLVTDVTVFEQVLKEHFSIQRITQDIPVTSEFLEETPKNTVLQTIVPSNTTKKTVFYVDTENVSFETILRLVSNMRHVENTEKDIELRLYSNTSTNEYTDAWGLTDFKKENVETTFVTRDSIIESKSLIDFMIVMDVTLNKDKEYDHVIVSSDSDFHVLFDLVPDIRVAYNSSNASSKYLEYLKDKNIESINMESLTTTGTLYTEYLKTLITKSVLNLLIAYPLKEWSTLRNYVPSLVNTSTLFGDKEDICIDLEKHVLETYDSILQDIKVDYMNGTVQYGEIRVSLT